MTQAELTDELAERAAQLLDEAEAGLGRPLTPEEEDSLVDEFLAGLDEGEEAGGTPA